MGIGYSIYDFCTTSYNEEKRDYYENLLNELREHLGTINTSLQKCETAIAGFESTYSSDEELYGKFIEVYCKYTNDMKDNLEHEIAVAKVVRDNLVEALEKSETLYQKYVTKCIEEDKENE